MNAPFTRPMAGQRDNTIIRGNTADVLEVAFGPRDLDSHVRAWKQHQFRLSDAGRTMMRKRLQARYPRMPLCVALGVYAVRDTDSYMDLRYI